MKTPRQISSERLIRHLERNWGYSFSRQHGSHIIMTAGEPARHSIPIPQRGTIGPGLLRSIFKQVCNGKGITLTELLKDL